MKNYNLEEIALEALESIPYGLDLVLYDDGTTAYLDHSGMTRWEFEGEVKRIARIDLSREHWIDTFLNYDLDIDDWNLDAADECFIHDVFEAIMCDLEAQLDGEGL